MYWRMVKNDIKQTKMITTTLVMFVAAAAMLVSLAAITAVHLIGSMNSMMEKAESPHFVQMHAGKIDIDQLNNFASSHPNVEKFQVVEFAGFDGAQITLGDVSLEHSIQDNGITTQNKEFDFLLDLNNEIIHVADGEIYVPIVYMKENITEIGDRATINGEEFTVAGFVRDSIMNSSLAASKRFLISESDFNILSKDSSMEYLISFRLIDYSKIGEFETDYAASGLPANGPTVTYNLFKLMNAISDGLMIAVILLISLLVVAISFICIRFTVLAKMEDEYREISVMKAIGLPLSDIKKIYLAKYVFITLTGSILGFFLALSFQGVLVDNIRLYMGESEYNHYGILLALFGIALVCFTVIGYVYFVLRQFKKISVTEALRFGTSRDQKTSGKRFSLSTNRLFSPNIFLGMKDVFSRKKLYLTSVIVLIFATFILIVPQNLHHTLSSKEFIKYMGIGDYDLHIQATTFKEMEQILHELKEDQDVTNYTVLTTSIYKMKTEDGREENLKIELGDHSVFPIAYTEGRAPKSEDEISLSIINAEELEKGIGDKITLIIDGIEKNLTVSGIYSDITNGGKTAKALFPEQSDDVIWSIISLKLKDSTEVSKKAKAISKQFPFAKTSDVDEYVNQTLGSTIQAVETASYAAVVIGLVIAALVTLLFMKMLIAKDSHSIAVLKAFGFTNQDIRLQYITRSMIILVIGVIFGTILANTVGESLAGALIASFGAATFEFVINPWIAYLVSPILLIAVVVIATWVGTQQAGKIKLATHIKE